MSETSTSGCSPRSAASAETTLPEVVTRSAGLFEHRAHELTSVLVVLDHEHLEAVKLGRLLRRPTHARRRTSSASAAGSGSLTVKVEPRP